MWRGEREFCMRGAKVGQKVLLSIPSTPKQTQKWQKYALYRLPTARRQLSLFRYSPHDFHRRRVTEIFTSFCGEKMPKPARAPLRPGPWASRVSNTKPSPGAVVGAAAAPEGSTMARLNSVSSTATIVFTCISYVEQSRGVVWTGVKQRGPTKYDALGRSLLPLQHGHIDAA